MAVIQAIISFIGRTVGKILSALLDWAVVSLFGRVTGNRKLFLWGMMAAAAAWPILLLGLVAPRAALFFFAFVPLSSRVPPGLVRTIWLAVAVLVPIAVGVTVGVQSPSGRREGLVKSVLRGFPIAAGLAAAFVILLVTVPALRATSMARGRRDTYVPLVTTLESYPMATKVVLETLERHGIAMASVEPPWWAALPSKLLQRLGQGAFTGYIAEQSAYFQNGELEAVLYPNALLLRGPNAAVARAHALAVEALTGHPDMFQTVSSEAQELERQIQRVWSGYRLNPQSHENAGPLLSRVDEIATEVAGRPLPLRRLASDLSAGAPARPCPRRPATDPRGDAPEGDFHVISANVSRAHRFRDPIALDAPAAHAAARDGLASRDERGRARAGRAQGRPDGRARHGEAARRVEARGERAAGRDPKDREGGRAMGQG